MNDFQDKILEIETNPKERIEINIIKTQKVWKELSDKVYITPIIKTNIDHFFERINYGIKNTVGLYFHKIILNQIAKFDEEDFYKIFLYIILFSIINFKYSKDPLISDNIVLLALNNLTPLLIRKKITYQELQELLVSLTLMLEEVFPEEKINLNKFLRKVIRKKIPEDDIAEKVINSIMSIKTKIIKSGKFGVNLNLNESLINLLKKLDPKIDEIIKKANIIGEENLESKEIIKESFSFDNVIKEENQGLALQAKRKWNYHKKKNGIKPPKHCSKCHKPTSECGPLEAAHSNYNQPLKIKWMCKSCHGKDNKRSARKRGPMGKYNPSGKWPKKY